MKNVWMGKTKSRRHALFLNNGWWEWSSYPGINCRLGQLMNPYLEDEQHRIAIELGKAVFLKFLTQADPKLSKVASNLGDMMPKMYSLYVLVPETIIHKLEVNYHLSVFNFLEQQNYQTRPDNFHFFTFLR